MRALRDLPNTWEEWSARATLIRALDRVSAVEARDALTRGLSESPRGVDPLDALRDSTELVSLLTG